MGLYNVYPTGTTIYDGNHEEDDYIDAIEKYI